MRLFPILAVLVLLCGCATLSEDECRGGDWQTIGRVDGAEGRMPDFLSKHGEACAEYGILPDRAAWSAGRAEGLLLYCTPASAYRTGRRGRALSPVCPVEAATRMQPAWEQGWLYWRLERDIERIEWEMWQLRHARFRGGYHADPFYSARVTQELSLLRLRLRRLELRQLEVASWP